MTLPELLTHINQLKKEADALRPFKPEDEQRLWKKFRLEWNYNSNHIEGNTLTYGETVLLLIFDKTTGDHNKREYDEMQAHDVAIKMVQELADDNERPLTESFIRKLNEIILVKPYWKEAITPDGQSTRREIQIGEYKSFPNSVRLQNGEMFDYASPSATPGLMNDFMEWYNENGHLHPVELAAQFHYKFVRIHPFDDGNGRVARLVMNYILMKAEYPPVIIKSKDKNGYLTALNKADAGDIESFTSYIGEQLVWSLTLLNKAAKSENIEEADDLDKEIELLKRSLTADNSAQITMHEVLFRSEWEKGLEHLLEEIDNKLQKFDPLFNKKELRYKKGTTIFKPLHVGIVANVIKNAKEPLLLRLDFEFKAYKPASTNYFDVSIWMEVELHEYKYTVVYMDENNQRTVKSYLYNQMVGQNDRENIAEQMAKGMLKIIKQRNGKD